MTTPAQPAPMVSAIDPHYSVNRLVIAMWEDAIRQASKGEEAARRWLYNEGVLWLDVIMDIHTDHTRRYLDRILEPGKKQKAHRKPHDERKRRKATQNHGPGTTARSVAGFVIAWLHACERLHFLLGCTLEYVGRFSR